MAEMTHFGAVSEPPESISLDTTTRDTIRYGRRANLSFPERRDEIYQGRIRFAVHQAKPLRIEQSASFQSVDDQIAAAANAGFFEEAADLTANRDQLERAQSVEQEKNITDAAIKGLSYKLHESAPIVDMYIPLALTFNETVNYDTNANLNTFGAGAMAAVQNGQGLIDGMGQALSQGLNDVFQLMQNGFADEAARLGALRLSKAVPNTGIQNAVSLGVQRALNPNTRALFRNVNLRQFNFAFKMIAESQREAETVENIVKHFRTELYPDVYMEGEFPIGYEFPNAFSIQFNYAGQKARLPKIERCFLLGVDTSFNSTSGTFHWDGRPTEVDMTLRFVEMRTLNRKDIVGGL